MLAVSTLPDARAEVVQQLRARVSDHDKHRHKTGHALFNTCLKNLLKDLTDRFPEVQEMRVVLTLYKLTKSLSQRLPHSLWCTMTDPFADYIEKHDASFFLDDNMILPKEFESFSYMVPIIRKCYTMMDEHDHRMVWGHIDLLMHISAQLSKSASTPGR